MQGLRTANLGPCTMHFVGLFIRKPIPLQMPSARHERSDPYSTAVSSVRDERATGSGAKGTSNSRTQQYTNEPDTLTRLCVAVEKLETRLSASDSTFNSEPHKGRKNNYDTSRAMSATQGQVLSRLAPVVSLPIRMNPTCSLVPVWQSRN